MAVDPNWILIIVGALLVLLEVVLGGFAGFDLVLIGTCIALGGAAGLFAHDLRVGYAVGAVLGVLYIVVGRRWVRARMRRPSVRTNTDALIGQRGLVTGGIEQHAPGQVKIHGEVWRARSAEPETVRIEAGSEVVIDSVEGVTLIVRRPS
jgi:membrane protein implicated in regulation of membrane protease activity